MMMKRIALFALLGTGAAVLGGCPIYPEGRDHRVCVDDQCFDCPDPYYSSGCTAWICSDHVDCPSGWTCASDRRCRPTGTTPPPPPPGQSCAKPSDCPPGSNCGADNRCHEADCATTGCPATFVCKLTDGTPQCVSVGTSTCQNHEDCPTPEGSKCLSGSCVAPADQCADGTQCAGDAQCVDGACTPACNAAKPCPTGYACDTAKGVCTVNPGPCTSSSQCAGDTVCVQEHCVERCGAGDTCPVGLVCVDGGCTPDQKPVFTCDGDGVGNDCQEGSICLRRSCYIGCDDSDPNACATADQFNVCKPVTTSTGTYSVCGSSSNLGTECDPTQSQHCASPLICIDGYCR
jgi:hypothetical protein